MESLNLKKQFGMFPMPVVIIGTQTDGKVDFMTAAWAIQLEYNPPMVGVVLSKNHKTSENIRGHGWFSLNIPTREQVKETDYVGIVSGREKNKAAVFPVFYGERKDVPMIENCGLSMECRLVQTVEISGDPFFIGKIEGMYSAPHFLTDGKPDFAKFQPFVFSTAEGSYWSLGENIGKAWKIGLDYKK
ncbi:MAG TPA: flavin reductase family protein [Thermotogota bacterium]|nr:flavin reductase family protein [Thermotogota bacterium]